MCAADTDPCIAVDDVCGAGADEGGTTACVVVVVADEDVAATAIGDMLDDTNEAVPPTPVPAGPAEVVFTSPVATDDDVTEMSSIFELLPEGVGVALEGTFTAKGGIDDAAVNMAGEADVDGSDAAGDG